MYRVNSKIDLKSGKGQPKFLRRVSGILHLNNYGDSPLTCKVSSMIAGGAREEFEIVVESQSSTILKLMEASVDLVLEGDNATVEYELFVKE